MRRAFFVAGNTLDFALITRARMTRAGHWIVGVGVAVAEWVVRLRSSRKPDDGGALDTPT